MLTHGNLVANAFNKILACSLVADDIFLGAPAMFHVAGIAPLTGLAWLGGLTVTVPAFDPALCLDVIARHRVTIFLPVPTMLAALVAEQRRAAARRLVVAHARSRRFTDCCRTDPSGTRRLSRHRIGPVLRSDGDVVGRHPSAPRGGDARHRPCRLVWPASCGRRRTHGATRRRRLRPRRGRRGTGPIECGHHRILEQCGGDSRCPARRLVPHGRPRVSQRPPVPVRRRQGEGHDRFRRRERVLGRGRGRVVPPSVGCRGGGLRSSRRGVGRGRARHRRSAPRHDSRRATS